MNATDEDMSYVKLYLLLPVILSVFERDMKITQKTFKTPDPYVRLIEVAMSRVGADLKEVRRKFRELGIKVYEENKNAQGIDAKYLCRGYHNSFNMLWSLVAAESKVLMEKYLGLDISQYVKNDLPEDMKQEI